MTVSFIRTIVLYVFILIAVRLMGKRQISELQTSELVVTLLISDIAAIPMQDTGQPLSSGIVPILVLVMCEIALSAAMLKNMRLRRIVCGNPVVVIADGKIDQQKMRALRMSTEDLSEELRQKDIFALEDVAYAIVETNGRLSVIKKTGRDPATAEQLGISLRDKGIETVIISDGEFSDGSLSLCGKTRAWAEEILRRKHLTLPDIFLMTANTAGDFHIVRKERVS